MEEAKAKFTDAEKEAIGKHGKAVAGVCIEVMNIIIDAMDEGYVSVCDACGILECVKERIFAAANKRHEDEESERDAIRELLDLLAEAI